MIDSEKHDAEDRELDLTVVDRFFTPQGRITSMLPGLDAQELDPKDPPLLPPIGYSWRVALTVLEFDVQIVFDLVGSVTLGRSFPDEMDLSPFNALELGLSRRHAMLTLQGNQIVIRDCGSTNGTLLNSMKLKPNVNYKLRSGDLVHLARMPLRFDLLYNPYESQMPQSSKP